MNHELKTPNKQLEEAAKEVEQPKKSVIRSHINTDLFCAFLNGQENTKSYTEWERDNNIVDNLIGFIDEVNSIGQSQRVVELEGDKWVSVDERLPETHGWYIVSYKGFEGNYVICVEYSTQSFKFKELHSQITHWQPLPSPPTP